jgi:hypothetical protein
MQKEKQPSELDDIELSTLLRLDLDEYRKWINKKIELAFSELEEIEYLVFLRGDIHEELQECEKRGITEVYDVARDLDRQWQEWIEANTWAGFSLGDQRDKHPKNHWWEWIDKLNELTTEDRMNL